MNNKDLMLILHNSSRKYIVERIENHKDQQTFLIVWNECQSLIRNSLNFESFKKDIDVLNWEYEMRAVKKWWPTEPKFERIAIDNALDIVGKLNERFGI